MNIYYYLLKQISFTTLNDKEDYDEKVQIRTAVSQTTFV